MESHFVHLSIRPSVLRDTIISEPNAQISFTFWLLLPLDHTLGGNFFSYFLQIFFVSVTWDPMAAKISKHSSYKSQPKALKLFLNFLPSGPHKATFGILRASLIGLYKICVERG